MKTTIKSDLAVLAIDPKIYSLPVIRGAAFSFIDRLYIRLEGDPQKKITIFLKAKPETETVDFAGIVGEFENELLNYSLREQLSQSNKTIRETVVAKALISAYGSPLEAASRGYQADPLGISKVRIKNSGKRHAYRQAGKSENANNKT